MASPISPAPHTLQSPLSADMRMLQGTDGLSPLHQTGSSYYGATHQSPPPAIQLVEIYDKRRTNGNEQVEGLDTESGGA